MDEPRESNLLEAELDLVDLSTADDEPSSSRLVHQSSLSKGFCVKEYEEQMDSLKKENFNLKLRLYFLEQNNTTLPDGIENFQKQFTDLKVENETLSNDLNEKQQLLQQASLALELLEEEKLNSKSCADLIIKEQKDKIKCLEQENLKLNHALNDMNKSNLGNDTGYADFLGAVDMRDIELQRKVLEMSQLSEEYKQQVNCMQQEILKLNSLLKDSESRAAALKYERDEMQDNFENAQSQSKLLSTDLENELKDFKEKWASTQCELNDVEQKLKESEEERQKTLKYLTKCLQTLDENCQKIAALESLIQQNQESGIDKDETKKDAEINDLRMQLDKMNQQLKEVTSLEVERKNQEIEKLSQIINNMKNSENKSLTETSKFSFDCLYESFNDLKFQQAMQVKKDSQKKVDELMQELMCLANSKTKEQLKQLKEQMAIVLEKQEMTDDALNRCAELCSYTLDHLYELTQFLSALLQNKEIRESLSNQSLINIQNILDKSVEFSRFSIDGRMSAFPDLSMLESLITTTRDSISNIRESQDHVNPKIDKSAQANADCKSCEDLKYQLNIVSGEIDEIKKINQLLEDEICEYREKLELHDDEIKKCNDEIESLKETKMAIDVELKDSENNVQMLQAEKSNLLSQLDINKDLLQKLEKRIKDFEDDLEANWMRKSVHEKYVKNVNDEAVNAEAQTAAIRYELEEIRKLHPMYKSNQSRLSINDENEIVINDLKSPQSHDSCKLQMQDIASQVTTNEHKCTDDEHHSLIPKESSSIIPCRNCPKYKAQNNELKKYLQACVEKLKKQSEQRNLLDRHVQKQINKTENFLQQAHLNMDNILKSKENLE